MATDAHVIDTLYTALVAEGFAPPAEAQRLHAALTSLVDPEVQLDAAKTALRAASLTGDADAVDDAQRALGLASNLRAAYDTFDVQRRDHAIALVRALYADAFTFVRGQYCAAGVSMARAVATICPDTSPEVVVLESKPLRSAWAAVPQIARDLDRLSKMLGDVIQATGRTYRPGRGEYAIGLLVTPHDAPLADLIRAWEWVAPTSLDQRRQLSTVDAVSGGRGGVWVAVLKLGGELRSPVTAVDQVRPIAEPEPVPVAPVASVATSWAVN